MVFVLVMEEEKEETYLRAELVMEELNGELFLEK